jgi:CDGSH-type Zn-finger protein
LFPSESIRIHSHISSHPLNMFSLCSCCSQAKATSPRSLAEEALATEGSPVNAVSALPDIEDLLQANCAGLAPKACEVKPKGGPSFLGGKYAWCTCGLSKSQPFCDGSHAKDPRGKGFQPLVFEVSEPKTAYLCTCKATKNPPYCDGSHTSLTNDNVGKPLPCKAICGGLAPTACELKPGGGPDFLGGKYAWCTCGLSKNQPFCDGSHAKDPRGKDFQPLVFEVTEPKTGYLCTCKATKNPPYCDGSHAALKTDNIGKRLP